jgi:phosphate transport system substrate-binding protein
LDFQTISDIYLNKIKKWNHENITKLNPGLTLPDQNITIVYENATSSPTYLITSALSQTVREFAERVRAQSLHRCCVRAHCADLLETCRSGPPPGSTSQ